MVNNSKLKKGGCIRSKKMRKLIINAEIRKSARIEINVDDKTYAALKTDSPSDVIGRYLGQAYEKADAAHNGIAYDYQIIDVTNGPHNEKILFDWDD